MITPVRPETFRNLQLNAGMFLVNMKLGQYTDAGALIQAVKKLVADNTVVGAAKSTGPALLGATIGGGNYNATPTIRHIDVDGKRYEHKGSTIIDAWDIRITGTLKEVTPGTVRTALVMADAVTEGNVTKITLHTDIDVDDYIETLCWVGDTSVGAMAIELKNALNTTGVNMTFTDKGEGTLPFTFVAHQDKVDDYDEAPTAIYFFGTPAEAAAAAAAAQSEPQGG